MLTSSSSSSRAMLPARGGGGSAARGVVTARRLRVGPARLTPPRATPDEDAALEARLERLRKAKGATPYGKGVKGESKAAKTDQWVSTESKRAKEKAKMYDYSGETLYYEGPPHRGDLAVNLALGTTLIWLPLTLAAVGRAAFVNYRFSDKRVTIATNAPWQTETVDVPYQEVKDIVTVGRGVGIWGDMVIEQNDGTKVELRSLDRFQELKKYILERRDALAPPPPPEAAAGTGEQGGKRPRGRMLTSEELMGEPAAGGKAGF